MPGGGGKLELGANVGGVTLIKSVLVSALPFFHPTGSVKLMVGSPPPTSGYKGYNLVRFGLLVSVCSVFVVTLVYVGFVSSLYSMQTGLIYVGSTNPVSQTNAATSIRNAGLVPWDHTTPGAAAPQGFVRPDFANPAPRGTIVFFHGNGEMAWDRAEDVEGMTQRGFRVFLYEYPGYGSRPGRPSEATIVPDAEALVDSLAKAGYGPIYLWGQSLGTGVAAEVCADKSLPIQGLTLVAPWDTIRNVGAGFYPYLPVRYLMRDKYDSIANLQDFGHPICVIRGDHDEVILPERTLNLYAHLPEPKKMILMAGHGHGDWSYGANESWWDEALDFIAPKASASPARSSQVLSAPQTKLRM